MNGAGLLVAALENEGVKQIFGVPGEENLDVVEALRRSTIRLVVTRHEQAAAFMAATHGRLTGEAGVCLSTLGPGALNLTTGAAYALLGAMPMIMITGQKGILSRKQARFQVVDIVATMTPLTKMARQIVSPASIPALVREAFRLAQQERPGPVHLELPEDIAHEEWADVPLIPPHPIDYPAAPPAALDRAAELIRKAERPLVMLGAAASRPRLSEALRWGLPRKQGYRIWRRLVVSTKVRRAAWRDLLSTKSRLSLREGLSAPRFLLRSRRRKLPYAIALPSSGGGE
jgi:acetolactate synthase I/II/III large subunit